MSDKYNAPWEVCEAGSWKNGERTRLEYFVRPENDETSIAVASDIVDHITGKPSKDIANLIAAAPELLEALERILVSDEGIGRASREELEAAVKDNSAPDIVREQASAILQGRAAIAKAKGAA